MKLFNSTLFFMGFLTACSGYEPEVEMGSNNSAQFVSERKIYIDPVTGLPATPPVNDQARQARVKPQALTAPVEVFHSDGSVSVSLDGRFQSWLKASKNCKGQLEVSHDEVVNSSAEPADC